ncbi:MAG TPA: exodeoxyribonuclease III [Candidatus Woesebacteria bacterium]|jgi:exodeoxyribonuclease-3|nr:exodeoxyribonuclease III [Candidatus Shapirobacteria bacterium]HOR01952.1 exodeoxyribonuclease III [Candidatus Woesebacteria bacterium]HPL01596.1 exodeoxyribonuclease III [bacterium]
MTEIKIISWNVAGIRAGIRKGLWQKMRDMGADIYCFQETKARKDQVPMGVEYPQEYKDFWNPAEKAGYSGVATFSKLEPKKVIVGDKDNDWDDEGRVIITKFDEFSLLNVYFPNGKRDKGRLMYKMEFYEYFLKYINNLRDKGERVIFCGDVNTAHTEIDLARPKENAKTSGFLEIERQWIDKLIANDWVDTFREFNQEGGHYSWWDQYTRAKERNVGWRIDYFFIDRTLRKNLKSAFILPEVEGSDHCPVGITIDL